MDCPHPPPLREPLEEALESEGGRLSASPDCLAPAHKIPHEQRFSSTVSIMHVLNASCQAAIVDNLCQSFTIF